MFFVNHGEDDSANTFVKKLESELNIPAYAPFSGAEFDMISGEIIVDAKPVPIPKKKRNTANFSASYSRLLSASERLSALVKNSSGCANADMNKLAEAINKLCDDWEF